MGIFFFSILLAMLMTAIFSYGYDGERRASQLFSFFLLLFLPIWAFSLWIPPTGPVLFGIAWMIPVAIAVFTLGLLAAGSSRSYFRRRGPEVDPDDIRRLTGENPERAENWLAGGLVFLLLVLLLSAVTLGQNAGEISSFSYNLR